MFGAFSFLYLNGICHCDLKPDNIIFHDGKLKVIVFGFAKFAETYKINGEERIMISGVAYAEEFQDPEYKYPHPIEVELYSIVSTIYHLHTRKYYHDSRRSFYISAQQFRDIGIEEDIINALPRTSISKTEHIRSSLSFKRTTH